MPPRTCAAVIALHPAYANAVRILPGDLPSAEPDEIHPWLRCTLQAHHTSPHYSLARDLPLTYSAEVWACWTNDHPLGITTLPDCATRNPHQPDDVCLLFHHHPGSHSWNLSDPDHPDPRTHHQRT